MEEVMTIPEMQQELADVLKRLEELKGQIKSQEEVILPAREKYEAAERRKPERKKLKAKYDNLKKTLGPLKDEKKKLETKKSALTKAIAAAKKAEDEALANAKDVIATTAFAFQTADGILTKKPAYVKFNRKIENGDVDMWIDFIKEGIYEPAYPIIAANASAIKKNQPVLVICDADGNIIPDDQLDDYLVIYDGQHRSRALMILILTDKYDGVIPNVVLKDDVVNIASYIKSLNPGRSWTNVQKVQVMPLTAPEEIRDFCCALSEAVRNGINPSTASLIYTFNMNHITGKQINELLSGQMPKRKINVNVEQGNTIISTFEAIGVKGKWLSKRYFIQGLILLGDKIGSEAAIQTLQKMQPLSEEQLKSVTSQEVFLEMLEAVK